MLYHIAELIVSGTTDSRRENDRGIVCIGGDVVDVYASAAYGEDDGQVRLVDVVVSTGDHFKGLKGQKLRDEIENVVSNAVAECYGSIGTDTFIRSSKSEFPSGKMVSL